MLAKHLEWLQRNASFLPWLVLLVRANTYTPEMAEERVDSLQVIIYVGAVPSTVLDPHVATFMDATIKAISLVVLLTYMACFFIALAERIV
jgi:AICAR transformylase/IMP cyclohydrolase PurH